MLELRGGGEGVCAEWDSHRQTRRHLAGMPALFRIGGAQVSTTWYAKIDCNFHGNRKAIKAGLLGRAVYVFVLCVNAQKGAPGMLSVDDLELWYVARELQITELQAREGIEKAVEAGLIEISDGIVTIAGWTDEYGKYPLTNPEKQKRYRERLKERKAKHENVTGVTDHGNAASNALPSVTQEGRKEGREGEGAPSIAPSPANGWAGFLIDNASHRGSLARWVWSRLSDIRIAVAADLGQVGVLPLTPITPQSSNQSGFRNLSSRISEEGDGAPAVCIRVLEVLTAQAREKRTLDWLSEKAFGENAWRFARETVPKWRAMPAQNDDGAGSKHWVDELGDEASA